MYSFPSRLKACLKSMMHGNPIKVKSGHTLVIAEGHEEPGFLAVQSEKGKPDQEVVFQIGSDVAWRMLIDHAKGMTKEETIAMMFSYAEIRVPGRY